MQKGKVGKEILPFVTTYLWRYIPAKIQVLVCNIDALNWWSFYNSIFNFCNSTFHIHNSTFFVYMRYSCLSIQCWYLPSFPKMRHRCSIFNIQVYSFTFRILHTKRSMRYAYIAIQHSCFNIELHAWLSWPWDGTPLYIRYRIPESNVEKTLGRGLSRWRRCRRRLEERTTSSSRRLKV